MLEYFSVKILLKQNILYLAWGQALFATIGSLYFSEIQHITPCLLCWYQRILMFPLVIIIAVGIIRRTKDLPYFVLPMSLLGASIAFYHYLLQRGVLPERIAPCTEGVSCASRFVEYFGFVTIPLLSFIAFSVISLAMILYLRQSKK